MLLNIIKDIEDLEHIELYPRVVVYKNMLSNPEAAYDTLMKSESSKEKNGYLSEWSPWSSFGTYSQPKTPDMLDSIPTNDQFNLEKKLQEEIANSYNKVISHYTKKYSIDLPESSHFSGNSYCKYFDGLDSLKNNLTMQYHTDYVIAEKEMPGPKFHITCTFYINDNYKGGDLCFYVNGDEFSYKPSAGDIVVFPSNEPYWHGVKTITDGNKFFIRNFVMYDYEGSPEWLANQRKYGAKRWFNLEMERLEKDIKTTMLYVKDGNIITYSDAYGNESVM
jgi:hypothetical protein